jgi:hypothetical protein
LGEETAAFYRSLGDKFVLGYLALVQGAGRRALEFFEEVDWSAVADARPVLEKAQAYLLAHRPEEALAGCEEAARLIPSPDDDAAPDPASAAARADLRRRYLRIEALRMLNRYDEAGEEASGLAEDAGGSDLPTEALLAWTLIEAGRAEEAYDLMQAQITPEHAPDEYVVPAAAAAGALGWIDEEIGLLERLIGRRMYYSTAMGEEVDFPVEAGRRLLELYRETERDAESVRGLALHLIDHDAERAETYRELLLELDRQE